VKATKYENEIGIEEGYLHRESIKEIPGRRYEAEQKAWFIPLCAENVVLLQTLGAELDAELSSMFNDAEANAVENEEPIAKMPIKAEPYKHQVRAFNFALKILCGEGSDANEIQRKT